MVIGYSYWPVFRDISKNSAEFFPVQVARFDQRFGFVRTEKFEMSDGLRKTTKSTSMTDIDRCAFVLTDDGFLPSQGADRSPSLRRQPPDLL